MKYKKLLQPLFFALFFTFATSHPALAGKCFKAIEKATKAASKDKYCLKARHPDRDDTRAAYIAKIMKERFEACNYWKLIGEVCKKAKKAYKKKHCSKGKCKGQTPSEFYAACKKKKNSTDAWRECRRTRKVYKRNARVLQLCFYRFYVGAALTCHFSK